jgi:hypothetical protein
MTSKRHAKPTAAQLSERMYRKVLEFKRTLLNQMALIRLDIVTARREDREHMKTLADHCARLLREKETLQRRLALTEAKPAKWEDFMKGTCPFADNHRVNQTCAVCGHLDIHPSNYTDNL